MILKKIQQLKTLFLDYKAYKKHKSRVVVQSNKSVLVNFENPQLYHRFFYSLLKFYQLAGYKVFFPMNFSTYRNLRNKDRYMALLVQEKGLIYIDNKHLPEDYIEIRDSHFDKDYFKDYFENENITGENYHVPMSFHPFMYNLGIWNSPVSYPENRHNAVFCYGNFDEKEYLEIKKTYFNVLSRTELIRFFRQQPYYISILSKEEILSRPDFAQTFAFALKENYSIEMHDVRPHLSLFNFFLCCPGVVKPICHNIIEAMSVGTIPLIEKEYADIMYPNLEHKKNALIFKDMDSLKKMIDEEIFSFSTEEISEMRENVFTYYENNLSPKGMVQQLNDHIAKSMKVYLQAGHRSVKFKKQSNE